MRIPLAAEHFTPAWLTNALERGGSLRADRVAAVEPSSVGEGSGLLGSLARLSLVYDGEAPGSPRSLIAKFPSTADYNRELARQYRIYEREYRFYSDVADTIPLRVPRAYYLDLDETVGDAVLLLEDLHPAAVGDQLSPPTDAQVAIALDQLTGLHAAWWDRAEAPALGWVPYLSDALWKNVATSFESYWPVFQQQLGHTLTPRLRALGDGFPARIPAILDRLSEPPITLIHADYRLDNLFFGTEPEQESLAVIDWQLMSRGRGAYDLAYFLAQNVEPERRARIEVDALRRYHERLCEHGVTGYTLAQCTDDYRLATLWSMVYPISAGGGMDLANERGVALATAMATRCFAAIEHLDADLMQP